MVCPKCGQEINEGSKFCSKCGSPIGQPDISTGAAGKPPGKASRRSIACLVLGIISLLLCGIPFFIPVILSIIELIAINKGKTSRDGFGFAVSGLVLGLISVLFMFFVGIFAAIAFPTFLQAQTRSQVGTTKAKLRMCATALEAYNVDYNTYPLPDYDSQGNPILPHALTTPVAYITSIPCDPFSPNQKQKEPYRYFAGPVEELKKTYWIIVGFGPDMKSMVDITKYNPLDPQWQESQYTPIPYDPTNGTTSIGNIYRTSP